MERSIVRNGKRLLPNAALSGKQLRRTTARDERIAKGLSYEHVCPCCKRAKDTAALLLLCRGSIVRVPVVDINLLLAHHKYVEVWTDRFEGLIEMTLISFAEAFPCELHRIHRNALVRLSRIERITGDPEGPIRYAHLKGVDKPAEISRRKWRALIDALSQKNLQRGTTCLPRVTSRETV